MTWLPNQLSPIGGMSPEQRIVQNARMEGLDRDETVAPIIRTRVKPMITHNPDPLALGEYEEDCRLDQRDWDSDDDR